AAIAHFYCETDIFINPNAVFKEVHRIRRRSSYSAHGYSPCLCPSFPCLVSKIPRSLYGSGISAECRYQQRVRIKRQSNHISIRGRWKRRRSRLVNRLPLAFRDDFDSISAGAALHIHSYIFLISLQYSISS
ncbi:hypothetical protein SERLA73DRAFT_174057, partial [Serpula lacrymans var. lacrymans S7.3]